MSNKVTADEAEVIRSDAHEEDDCPMMTPMYAQRFPRIHHPTAVPS